MAKRKGHCTRNRFNTCMKAQLKGGHAHGGRGHSWHKKFGAASMIVALGYATSTAE